MLLTQKLNLRNRKILFMQRLLSVLSTPLIKILMLITIGQIAYSQGEKDILLASQYYKKADSLLTEEVYKNSIDFFEKSLLLYQKNKDWEKAANCFNKISSIQNKISNFTKSLENANNALEICEKHLQDNSEEKANAFDNIGHYHENNSPAFQKALDYFQKALEIRLKISLKDPKNIALSYDNIGVLYHRQGEISMAIKNYDKALEIRLKNYGENHPITSKSYIKIGMLNRVQGKNQEAISNFNKALDILIQKYGEDHIKIANLHSRIAGSYTFLSAYEKAEFHIKKALEIKTNSNSEDRKSLASLYYKLGMLYIDTDRFKLSEKKYQKALEIYTELYGDQNIHVANAYYGLGSLYGIMGFHDKKLDYLQKSLKIYLKKAKNHSALSNIYHNMGNTYVDKGAYEKALQFYKKSIDISIKTVGKEHYLVSYGYSGMASVYQNQNNYDLALEYNNKSLKIRISNFGEDHPIVATSYNKIGDVFLKKEQYDNALHYYKAALNVYKKTFNTDYLDTAKSLAKIGVLKQEKKQFDEALHYFNESLEMYKRLYVENNGVIADIYNHIAKTYSYSEKYQDALQNYDNAQKANNKYKIDEIKNNNTSSYNNYIDPNISLTTLKGKAKIYKDLYQQNNDLNDLIHAINIYLKIDPLINTIRQTFTGHHDKVNFARITKEIYHQAIECHMLLYAAKKDPKSLEKAFYYAEKSKANILKELLTNTNAKKFTGLPEEILVLEKKLRIDYAFYQSKIKQEFSNQKIDTSKIAFYENNLFDINQRQDSLSLVIEKNYSKYYQFKHKNTIVSIPQIQEQLNENSTLLEFFTSDSNTYAFTINKNTITVQKLITPKLIDKIERFRNSIISKDIHEYKTIGNNLYNQLITPVIDQLIGDELIIIPDGPLWQLDFELLLTKKESSNNPSLLPYMLRDYITSYTNSANLLFTPITTNAQPVTTNFQSKPKQECLAFSFSNNTQDTLKNVLSLAILRDASDDLPGTRKEIKAISNIIDGQYYFGKQAVESNFKKYAGQYNILHLALHGDIDNENPNNSKLYFTKSNDSIEDDLLYSHELFALDIPAELTVLSACNTGTGKITKGEGIMSLGTAFQYAGTESLLLTRWEVSDQTTPELMKYFYTHLRSGMNKGKALQQAKLDYLSTGNINRLDPFYWGGFYLVGNSAPVSFHNNYTWLYWVIGLGGLIWLLFLFRKKNNS